VKTLGVFPAHGTSEAVTTALQWVNLGYVRHAATLIAWLAALRVFALFYAHRG
jgi:hypothetical protein